MLGERTLSADREFLQQLEEIVKQLPTCRTSRTIVFVSAGFNRATGRELYANLPGYGVREGIFI
jgi:hypothetical protein